MGSNGFKYLHSTDIFWVENELMGFIVDFALYWLFIACNDLEILIKRNVV